MKFVRVLLIAVFLFSAIATSAQAPGQATGFVPLLTRVDPTAPIQMQTQDAFNSMLGNLMAAQKRGEIIKFEPSLATGVLKVVYRASANTAALFPGIPVYDDMREAAASMKLPDQAFDQLLNPAGPGTQAGGHFILHLYDNSFFGYALTPNAHLIASLRDKTGIIVSVFEGNADISGRINGYFTQAGSYADVIPGYKVTFKEYSGTTLLNTYTATAPSIKFSTIDKTNSIVTGTGPASKPFGYSWQHQVWNAANDILSIYKTGTSSSTGTWRVDFGTIPLRGRDALGVWADVTTSIRFVRSMAVPYMFCRLGGNYCVVDGFAFKPATLTIVHGGATYNFNGKSSAEGSFSAELVTSEGDPIFLKAGDKASGTDVPAWALPNLTAAIDYTSDIISGKAPPYKYFNLGVYKPSNNTWYGIYAHSNVYGIFAEDFTSQIDLDPLQPVVAEVFYVHPPTGNHTIMDKSFGP